MKRLNGAFVRMGASPITATAQHELQDNRWMLFLRKTYKTDELPPQDVRNAIKAAREKLWVIDSLVDFTTNGVIVPDSLPSDAVFYIELSGDDVKDLFLGDTGITFTHDVSGRTHDCQAFIPYSAIKRINARPQWEKKFTSIISAQYKKALTSIYVGVTAIIMLVGVDRGWTFFNYNFFSGIKYLWSSESTVVLYKLASVFMAIFELVFVFLIAVPVFIHEYFGVSGLALEILVIASFVALMFFIDASDEGKVTASEVNLEVLGLRPIFQKRRFRIQHNLCLYCGPFSEEYTIMYKEHIRDPLLKLGIEVERADEITRARPVMDDLWESINRSAIIIAELSGCNPNVLYEVGMAHTVGKKVLIISQSAKTVPFDIGYHRVLEYDNTEEGLKKIERQIVATVQYEIGMRLQAQTQQRSENSGRKITPDQNHRRNVAQGAHDNNGTLFERIAGEGNSGQAEVMQSASVEDLLGYQKIVGEARRSNNPRQVIRDILAQVAEHGIPEPHCINITFRTKHEGVVLGQQVIQHKSQMTLALQHQFWDLEVNGEGFAVTLSFNGVRERLFIPYDAVTVFGDPKAQFAISFT